jgi:hypothetical protein
MHLPIVILAALLGIMPQSAGSGILIKSHESISCSDRIEAFTFFSDGKAIRGKIFIPATFKSNKNLPSIYLIDFTEQHFKVAVDEFEKVIDGVRQIQGFDALIVTLESHLDEDTNPDSFEEFYTIFKHMTYYVDSNYTSNTSRTFMGRGSESGIVMLTLFKENPETSVFEHFIATDSPRSFNKAITDMIETGDFPMNKQNKKLHFSFSTSNNRDNCTHLINAISGADYPWLQFESFEFKDSDYESTYPFAFAAGLKFVFDK